jgi:hypothetical protein
MTTLRDEIIIEGSNDGENWEPYIFKWKPQEIKGGLSQVAPFQPRLDWQMWFAALSSFWHQGWLQTLLQRLLEGDKRVEGLFKECPFKDAPPKYIRTLRWRYKFCSMSHWRKTGHFWQREFIGPYGPVFSLKK